MKIIEDDGKNVKIQMTRGSNNIATIPCFLSEELAYIVAAILCDGHLKKDNYRVGFELVSKDIVMKFIRNFSSVFDVKFRYNTRIDKRGGRKVLHRAYVNSKPIVLFLRDFFEIPRGKKSDIIKIPELIKKSNMSIRRAFIEGVFDTDGGKRRGGFGLSSASVVFRDDVTEMLMEFGIDVKKDEWLNKKYDKRYYGLFFKNPISGGTQAVKGA